MIYTAVWFPRLETGPLHSLPVVPTMVTGQLGTRNDVKGTNGSQSYMYHHLFHTTFILRLIFTFKCIFGAVWHILCWNSIKSTKKEDMCQVQASCFRSMLIAQGQTFRYAIKDTDFVALTFNPWSWMTPAGSMVFHTQARMYAHKQAQPSSPARLVMNDANNTALSVYLS